MTRVLLLGPVHDQGSLPPYLDVLTSALRDQGAVVTRYGSTAIPYDHATRRFHPPETLHGLAATIAEQIDPNAHDVIAVHAGNLEVDQLVPALLGADFSIPIVHHGHTLAPTLLREHSPDPALHAAVTAAITQAAGHLWFGGYARERHARHHPPAPRHARARGRKAPESQVAWLPTTIPPGTRAAAGSDLATALQSDHPIVSLYGFAAPWKDARLLRDALTLVHTPLRMVLAGDFWDDPAEAGTDLGAYLGRPGQVGRGAELVVVPGYLDPAARLALVQASSAAVFPYRPYPSFQGSGAIADYLAHQTPVVATDTANMSELIGPAGAISPPGDPAGLARAIDRTLTNPVARSAVRHRARRFTPAVHATRCLRLYRAVIDRAAQS